MAYSLPTARQIWNCKDCEQEIYKSTTQKFASGKYKILNFRNGKGGNKDDPHVCPKRVGSKFHHFDKINMRSYDFHEQHKCCPICAETYNSQIMPLCPTCFKFRCRNCFNMQSWSIHQGRICSQCGGECDVQQVFWAYQRLYPE